MVEVGGSSPLASTTQAPFMGAFFVCWRERYEETPYYRRFARVTSLTQLLALTNLTDVTLLWRSQIPEASTRRHLLWVLFSCVGARVFSLQPYRNQKISPALYRKAYTLLNINYVVISRKQPLFVQMRVIGMLENLWINTSFIAKV